MSKKKDNVFHTSMKSYKPMLYPEAYDKYVTHEKAMHWSTDEIELHQDVKDWAQAPINEKHIITSVFQGFTQNDLEVGGGYDLLCRILKPNELKMLFRSLGNRESLHQDAYSLLLDTLGFPEEFYKEYEYIPSLSLQYDYIHKAKVKQFHQYVERHGIEQADYEFRKDVARMLAIYSGGIEGISLFSQFAILANFSMNGKYPGMKKVTEWSIRDESYHIESNAWLFKIIIKENKEIWNDDLKRDIYSAFREVVKMNDDYIDYCFSFGEMTGLTKEKMKIFVRYLADTRLKQFALKSEYNIKEHPLPEFDEMINNVTFSNFFDSTVSEYSKSTMTGSWEEAKNKMYELFGSK